MVHLKLTQALGRVSGYCFTVISVSYD